jgi:cytochrome c oxidase cbb3-type subunit I/II
MSTEEVERRVAHTLLRLVKQSGRKVEQGIQIVKDLETQSRSGALPDTQIVALIAYLQKLGKYDVPDIEGKLKGTPAGILFPLKPGIPDGYRTSAVTK